MTITRTFEIKNETGFHARPSASFVKLANQYKSNITVNCNGCSVNGKSIIGLMQLGAGKGSQLEIIADGNDASVVLQKIGELIDARFNEK